MRTRLSTGPRRACRAACVAVVTVAVVGVAVTYWWRVSVVLPVGRSAVAVAGLDRGTAGVGWEQVNGKLGPADRASVRVTRASSSSQPGSWLGFPTFRWRSTIMPGVTETVAVFPLWLPAALGAAGTVWFRPPARPPSQRCRRCGYDLRASPDRCPECGATPGVT